VVPLTSTALGWWKRGTHLSILLSVSIEYLSLCHPNDKKSPGVVCCWLITGKEGSRQLVGKEALVLLHAPMPEETHFPRGGPNSIPRAFSRALRISMSARKGSGQALCQAACKDLHHQRPRKWRPWESRGSRPELSHGTTPGKAQRTADPVKDVPCP
jgi:hypothetical protein